VIYTIRRPPAFLIRFVFGLTTRFRSRKSSQAVNQLRDHLGKKPCLFRGEVGFVDRSMEHAELRGGTGVVGNVVFGLKPVRGFNVKEAKQCSKDIASRISHLALPQSAYIRFMDTSSCLYLLQREFGA